MSNANNDPITSTEAIQPKPETPTSNRTMPEPTEKRDVGETNSADDSLDAVRSESQDEPTAGAVSEPPAAKPSKPAKAAKTAKGGKAGKSGARTRAKRKLQAKVKSAGRVSATDRQDFKHHHAIVVKAVKPSVEAGISLKIIHDRKLWRAGNYPNWNAYCILVQGLTRRYANQLIETAVATEALRKMGETSPTSSGVAPKNVTQVLPLLCLKSNELRLQAWEEAVKCADGAQVTGNMVKQAVAKILPKKANSGPPAPTAPEEAAKWSKVDLIARLKVVVEKRESWEAVDQLLNELEKCA